MKFDSLLRALQPDAGIPRIEVDHLAGDTTAPLAEQERGCIADMLAFDVLIEVRCD